MREITQLASVLPGSPRSESIDLGNRLIPFLDDLRKALDLPSRSRNLAGPETPSARGAGRSHRQLISPCTFVPRDIRRLCPVATKHDRHAPLRVVAGGIEVAADLLTRRHIERIVEESRSSGTRP